MSKLWKCYEPDIMNSSKNFTTIISKTTFTSNKIKSHYIWKPKCMLSARKLQETWSRSATQYKYLLLRLRRSASMHLVPLLPYWNANRVWRQHCWHSCVCCAAELCGAMLPILNLPCTPRNNTVLPTWKYQPSGLKNHSQTITFNSRQDFHKGETINGKD